MASVQRKTRRAHERLTTLQEDVERLQTLSSDQAAENHQLEELLSNQRTLRLAEEEKVSGLADELVRRSNRIDELAAEVTRLIEQNDTLLNLDSDAKGLRRRLHAAKQELATRNTEINRLKKEKAAGW